MSVPGPMFCACCTPSAPLAPAAITNRPGLGAIVWATGSYATFRQAMFEGVARGPRNPAKGDDPHWPAATSAALRPLTTRDDSDYAIMAIDMFAAVADVLSFYSERQANEMFLRTARERDSVLRLAGLIGFQPSPGSAATTALAFTLDAGAQVRIAPGLKVMSVPGQDEKPQTFETIGTLVADAALGDLPVYGVPQAIVPFGSGRRIPLVSRPEALARGDTLVLTNGQALEMHRVTGLEQADDGEYLDLARNVGIPGVNTFGFKLKRELALFGHNAPASWSHYDPALAPALRWTVRPAGSALYPVNIAGNRPSYRLSRIVSDVQEGALLMVDLGATVVPPNMRYIFAHVDLVEQSNASFGPLADTVTAVRLTRIGLFSPGDSYAPFVGQSLPFIPDVRQTRVFELEWGAVAPRGYRYPANLSGSTLHLRSDDLGDAKLLAKDRWLMLTDGKRRHLARSTGVTTLAAGADGVAHFAVGFTPPLGQPLTRARLNANVAPASHGETQPDEPLGHGDGAKLFQSFRLQRGGLTHLPAAPAPQPELAVRVNDMLWQRVPSLFGQPPSAQVYTLATDAEGKSMLRFGDGTTGARLPSGANNVVARYRTGLGREGRLRADQLATLLTRPVGLRAVTNPWPTDGGRDPDHIDDTRAAAPATVRTFGRAVSLADFADVARETGLAARAIANWAWIDFERAVQLSVAGPEGDRLSAAALGTLADALDMVRDPNLPLVLGQVWPVPLRITARLLRDPAYLPELVEKNARAALDAFFAFEARDLGGSVHLSQVAAAIQGAMGVLAVDIDHFHVKGAAVWPAAALALRGLTTAAVQPNVRIFGARPRKPLAQLDPLAQAGLALDPDVRALPAEQAFIQSPGDVILSVVEAL